MRCSAQASRTDRNSTYLDFCGLDYACIRAEIWTPARILGAQRHRAARGDQGPKCCSGNESQICLLRNGVAGTRPGTPGTAAGVQHEPARARAGARSQALY